MTAKKKIENETPESEVIQDEVVEVEDKIEEAAETETEVEVDAEAEEVTETETVVEEESETESQKSEEVDTETEVEVDAEAEEVTETETVVEEESETESQKTEEVDTETEVEGESETESVPYISPDGPVRPVPVAAEKVDENEDEEEKIDVDRAKWYTIRTFSGQERKIMESLLATIDREGMEDRIFQVLVPTENVVEMRDGKKRHRVKVNFPGYVLIQMDLDKETQFLVEDAYGVLNFIGPGNKPQALGMGEVRRILGDAKDKAKGRGMAAPYAVGDSIKVVDGPFNDFAGYVQEINREKQKVKVMVSIFGRATPVELDFLQVQIEK